MMAEREDRQTDDPLDVVRPILEPMSDAELAAPIARPQEGVSPAVGVHDVSRLAVGFVGQQ